MTDRQRMDELGKCQAVHTEILTRIETSLKDINKHLLGNGKPGLLTRVDRLEVWDKLKNKVLWFLGGTVVTCGLTWFFEKF